MGIALRDEVLHVRVGNLIFVVLRCGVEVQRISRAKAKHMLIGELRRFQTANLASAVVWATGILVPGAFGLKWLQEWM